MPVIDSGIIDITVNRETATLPRDGFGMALIIGTTEPLDEEFETRTRKYTKDELSAIGEDFGTDSPEYEAATAYFSQTPAPSAVRVAIRDAAVATVKKIIFDADLVTLNVINGTVNGTALSATTFATDHLTTMNAIAAKIDAIEGVASATVGGSGNREITVTATVEWELTLTGFVVTLGAGQAAVTYSTTTPGRTVEDDLIEAENEIDDWYGLLLAEYNKGAAKVAEGYTEARKKLFGFESDESDALETTTDDIFADSEAQSLTRAFGLWHQDTAEHAAAAWMGRCFPIAPGGSRFALRTLAGITVTGRDTMTSSQKTNVLNKKGNVYIETGGRSITMNGTVFSGEFIDTIRDIDYFESELTRDLFSLIVNNEKIPMTEAGLSMVYGTIDGFLKRMITEGVIDSGYTITMPKLTDISADDRASRILQGIKIVCRTTGGIHTIKATVTVEV